MQAGCEAVILPACGIARATVFGTNSGCSTRHEDPSPSHLLLEEKSSKCAGLPYGTPRGRGVLISLSPAAVPGGPDTDHANVPAGHVVMVCAHAPALSRFLCGTRTASTLDAGLCAGSAALRLPRCGPAVAGPPQRRREAALFHTRASIPKFVTPFLNSAIHL